MEDDLRIKTDILKRMKGPAIQNPFVKKILGCILNLIESSYRGLFEVKTSVY